MGKTASRRMDSQNKEYGLKHVLFIVTWLMLFVPIYVYDLMPQNSNMGIYMSLWTALNAVGWIVGWIIYNVISDQR